MRLEDLLNTYEDRDDDITVWVVKDGVDVSSPDFDDIDDSDRYEFKGIRDIYTNFLDFTVVKWYMLHGELQVVVKGTGIYR